jgi:uncharacterized Fe-S cluster-containing radical SAM superfamily protein
MSALIARERGAPRKFDDPRTTLDGKTRATVALTQLETLWFNTGTLCNITCVNCYIESSPRNDRLAYLALADVTRYLDEIAELNLATRTIGLTGGEPFMNPDIDAILTTCLERGFDVLVLTNAMRPMMHHVETLRDLQAEFGDKLIVRVSLDHYRSELHEEERGKKTWAPTLKGLRWLSHAGIKVHVAGRTRWGGDDAELRVGFAELFAEQHIEVDAQSATELVLFPEMDIAADVPEITTECWGILGVDPAAVMCASSRMVIKRSGAAHPVVVSCTLIPYDARFEMGATLAESLGSVSLNHPHCAKFCVLGGGSCTG